MKRARDLYDTLISDENLTAAIQEVNRTHRWLPHHRPNRIVAWVEKDIPARVEDLRKIIVDGFEPSPVFVKRRWDKSANKWRDTKEPRLWPDQYVHHAEIQALHPVMMRGMDKWCCGSIRGRGNHYGQKAIVKWMAKDPAGTKYCAELDIHHFYETLKPEVVFARMKRIVKDRRVLDLVWRTIKDGIIIGGYFSQWYANTTLQPLDHLIREGGFRVSHYARNIDNFTIFSPNKRALHRLKKEIDRWLGDHGMSLKDNWQIFRTDFTKAVKEHHEQLDRQKQKFRKPRLPNALGYRYGHGYTLLRKRNLLRLKRQLSRFYKKREKNKRVPASMAQGLLSRIGQLVHCKSRFVFQRFVKPGTLDILKSIVRVYTRKERAKWNMNSSSVLSSATASWC